MNRIDSLESWRIFVAVADAGGVRAAGEKLSMEAGNVSRSIKALETALGSLLFVHNGRPAELTEFGRRAREGAERLLSAHRDLIDELLVDPTLLEGPVRVAAHAATSQSFMTPALVEFQENHPKIVLSLRELLTPASFEAGDDPPHDVLVTYVSSEIPPDAVRLDCGPMAFVACASPFLLQPPRTAGDA